MDGPYRLTTQKTAKDRVKGHWYYYYSKGGFELKIWGISGFLDPKNTFINHEKAKYWSKKNYPITPYMVALKSGKKYWFNCDNCVHEFETSLDKVVCYGSWCPYCCIPTKRLCNNIECKMCFDKSFASSSKINYWDYSGNEINPRNILKTTRKEYKFICGDCGHSYISSPRRVIKMETGCHFCCAGGGKGKLCDDTNCKKCFNKSFASHSKAKFWSLKNGKIKPRDIRKGTSKSYWFDCPCGHTIYKRISNITCLGSWCGFCSIPLKMLCGEDNCDKCRGRSIASHPESNLWSKENKTNPLNIALYCNKKFLWYCKNCKTDFPASCNNFVTGRRCPTCKNKTEKKLLEWLEKQSFIKQVKHQYKPEWFKYHCIIKGEPKIRSFTYSYDFLVTLQNGKQLIIELDGRQHYQDVSYFKSIALHQQIRDKYKERKARQHKLKVIRILQEDVYYDRNDWEDMFLRKIKNVN